ncbi:CheW-like domain protein [Neomoorella glycerini]|uniref:CheW-like domain protein n=1 Tax=Neomoorella glycerini TaxID=55779 RepID=A0A6I5ZLY1_9FIRM|nr:chemotaxis protein CheW [Moorella glycerini]QGP90882.1 CheW-like domain protein [Moorella glycerini]
MRVREDGDVAVGSKTGQYVVFKLGPESYGIVIDHLQEIIRVPAVVRVPMTPPYIRGLANLRGTILTVYDTRMKMGLESTSADENSRVIVVTAGGRQAGFIVDRIEGVMDIPAEAIEEFREGTAGGSYVSRAARIGEGRLVLLVDMAGMIAEMAGPALATLAAGNGNGHYEAGEEREAGRANKVQESEQQLLIFRVGGEEYALNIADVKEIVHLPEEWNALHEAPPYVLGLISLRDQVLPLISMRRVFGLGDSQAPGGRVIVAYAGQGKKVTAGIVVDSLAEVLRVNERSMEPVPAILRQGAGEIAAVCRLGEKRMVFVLDSEKLLGDVSFLTGVESGGDAAAVGRRRYHEEEYQLVTFELGKEEFALPIKSVREIIRAGHITAVPGTRSFVRGIFNLRGSIVPVIDLRRRFAYPERPPDEQDRILICEGNGSVVGLMVDGVREVLKILASKIEAAPPGISQPGGERPCVSGIAKLEKGRNVIILDAARVLMGDDGWQA